MPQPTVTIPEEQLLFLSSLSPGPAQKRLALGVVFGIVAVFALITVGLLSGVQTKQIDAFLPAYLTAMFVCDSMTAILLFAQFSILRSRSILVIASAYLFTALILIPYILTFPGVFVAALPTIGGQQSSGWIYVLWHCGFPLFVIAYALSKDGRPTTRWTRSRPRAAIVLSIALTAALVSIAAFVCIEWEPLLPHLMADRSRFTPLWPYLVGAPIATASTTALVVLWFRRRSMLDLWLMVVMFLYLVEVPLSYYPSPSRFSPGWYAVRIFGFLSSSLVLVVLLYEIETLYARLLGAVLSERREREARLMTGNAVAASIAHEVRQPLTAMITSADAGYRFLDRPIPNLDRAKEAFRLIASDGHRAGEVVENIRANFRSDARTRLALDVNELIRDALVLERENLEKHGISVETASNEQLPDIRANRVQLQQVLLNLIANAIHAMAGDAGPRTLCVRSEAYHDDSVMVSVLDTGKGIDAKDVGRIFDPLYTTKADGMGMGLSICRAIIEAHNGRLWFAPNVPRGAAFHFTLHADRSVPAVA